MKMKKLTIIILATLLILSLVGCAGANETADLDVSTNDTDTRVDSSTSDTDKDGAKQSYDNVPGTNVPMYPNAQQVYSSKNEIVYATTDSGEAVNDFFESHPNLKKGKGSGSFQEGYYFYETPLADLVRDLVRDKCQEKIDEMNAYINEFGGLTGLHIYDVNVDSQFKELSLDTIISELPLDKTLIMYGFQEEL